MELRPLGEIVARVVDDFVAHSERPFDKEEVVERVLVDPEVRLMREGLEMHDRAEGLENIFRRDVRRKVTARLRRDGCVAENTGGGVYRWHPPERMS